MIVFGILDSEAIYGPGAAALATAAPDPMPQTQWRGANDLASIGLQLTGHTHGLGSAREEC